MRSKVARAMVGMGYVVDVEELDSVDHAFGYGVYCGCGGK